MLSFLFFLGLWLLSVERSRGHTDLVPSPPKSTSHQPAENNEVLKKKGETEVPLSYAEDSIQSSKQIPVHLLMQLKEISSMDELFDKMIQPTQRYKRRGLKSAVEFVRKGTRKNKKMTKTNYNETNLDEDSVESPAEIGPIFDKRAFCHPRRQPVNIPQPKDATLIYQPMCIQIEKCGGCCSHELFECVPSIKKNATRKVIALRYPRAEAEYFLFESVARVRIERHIKCSCRCKVQPEDCSSRQIYDRQNCRCICAQVDGHLKCKDPQVWMEKECRCRCPEYSECSTGTYFDTKICRCRGAGEILTQGKMLRLAKSMHHN